MTARPEAEHDPVNDLLPVYENTPTTQCECEKKKKEPAQAGTQYETKLFTLEAHIPSLMSRKQHSYDSDNADE